MRHRNLETLTRIVAALLAVGLPLLLAVGLVRAAGAPGEQLARGLLGGRLLLAQAPGGAPAPAAAGLPLVSGVLYARGALAVDWNGVSIPVRDGSYAYVGGETVRVQPGAIAMLRLPGGAQIVMCGGSQTALVPLPGGGYRLDVARGSARFQFPRGTTFSVHANDTTVTPDPRTGAGETFEGEVQARGDGSCLVCELRQGVRVRRGDGGDDAPPAEVGRVIEVASGGPGGAAAVHSTPIPPRVMAAAGSASGQARFLCRCEDLKREAEEAGKQVPQQQAAEETPPESPPTVAEAAPPEPVPPEPQAVESVPPVAPPDAPPVSVAEPGAPDPFDPNVLPPPAAGEPVSPVVVLPPPAVPFSGTGVAGGGGGVTDPPQDAGPIIAPPVSDSGGGVVASPS